MRLTACDFPPGTPLHNFFLWNECRRFPDRRYRLARDPDRAPAAIKERLAAAIGNPDIAAHAAVFAGFEAAMDGHSRRILVIRLSALGDFIQSLGPFAAIRRRHREDRITLLTTRPFAAFAAELGYFDAIIVDERPGKLAPAGWLALRRRLRQGRFDRVYDLQTAQRSAAYAWLLRPGPPQWSGIAWGCSHPHANLHRDRQHTLDKQAEQLLMAGIYPTPPPQLPPFEPVLPAALAGRDFVLLAPGSSPHRPAKRWPASYFAAAARALAGDGFLPVVVGSAAEAPLGRQIGAACPAALDLVGRTDLGQLAALAHRARLTIGNDTGVSHLAAAAGCPLIVLFSRESDPARCAPRGRLVRVIAAPDLGELPVAAVTTAAREILASAGRATTPGVDLLQ
ncbi:MAG TPA: glycosyltransferase family 9 protein [Stellaceae bacterium]|nr:glycosyltransferase family 9 protein [Stellaceae bacterium]